MSRKRIAVVHPEIGFVGTETVFIWLLEALRKDYKIDVFTCRSNNLANIDNFYGTSISEGGIDLKQINIPRFLNKTPRARLLKQHFLMRYCKRYNGKFDLFFSTYNEMDFGKRGIQYIHFPEINVEAKFVLRSKFYRESLQRNIYQRLSWMISGYSKKRVKNNLTLVNSQWTKRIVDSVYGIDSIVVYPPVLDDFEEISWQDKENGFVFIGRISPDKRPLEVVQILKKVRERGFDVHLHILGNTGIDRGYIEKVRLEALTNPSWVFYEGKVSREKLRNIVSSHKYGISGKKFEHFGIAIAEMAKAGCIVFVNNDGGQVEIVGEDENLIYTSDEEAANKIVSVLSSEGLQKNLLEKLKNQSQKYSKENFMSQIKNIVREFLDGKL